MVLIEESFTVLSTQTKRRAQLGHTFTVSQAKVHRLRGVASQPGHVGDDLVKVGALIAPILVDDGLCPGQIK